MQEKRDLTEHKEEIPAFVIDPAVVFSARSFFFDRAIPGCDVIQLPEKIMPSGEVKILEEGVATKQPYRRIRDRFRGRGRGPAINIDKRLYIDFRYDSPQNWSHLLNMHIPLLALVELALEVSIRDICVIFPANMPKHSRLALEILGVKALFTDRPVAGLSIRVTQSHGNIHRPRSREWILSSSISSRLDDLDYGRDALPERVLIARRGTRTILNQDEIEAALRDKGFKTIYAEDLEVVDQFRIFSKCETVVGIHGAAFGPLLYRSRDRKERTNIVELVPCGISSDIFRMMAQQTGCRWIGVRGRIKPKYVTPAYDLKQNFFSEFQDDCFEVDPASLLCALEHVWNADNFRVAPLKELNASKKVICQSA